MEIDNESFRLFIEMCFAAFFLLHLKAKRKRKARKLFYGVEETINIKIGNLLYSFLSQSRYFAA